MYQLDLKEVYMKDGRAISYDQKVCLLCMQLVQSEFGRVNDEELDAIQNFFPKVVSHIAYKCEWSFDKSMFMSTFKMFF